MFRVWSFLWVGCPDFRLAAVINNIPFFRAPRRKYTLVYTLKPQSNASGPLCVYIYIYIYGPYIYIKREVVFLGVRAGRHQLYFAGFVSAP